MLWGPELEFHLFDEVRFHSDIQEAFYRVDSGEAYWNSGREGSRGYGIAYTKGSQADPPRTSTATCGRASSSISRMPGCR